MSQLNRGAPGKRAARPQRKTNTFFGGAAILAVGIMAVKFIGMFYKIALTDILGTSGMTDFTNAYNIYSVLLTVSTAGLPVAVSKLVSEANALGRRNQVNRVFRLSLTVFLTVGVFSFLLMYFGSDGLADLMNDPLSSPAVKALAPAVVCVGCLSAFRGYSQGHQNMTPTAVSQILEAVTKLVLGLALASYVTGLAFTAADLAKYRPNLDTSAMTPEQLQEAVAATQTSQAAAGAITGVTVGTVLALVYMVLSYLLRKRREERRSEDTPQGMGTIFSSLMKIAIPITLSASMVGIVTVIDSSLVQGQLQKLYMAVNGIAEMTESNEQEIINYSRNLYGNYAGALNIYNLPQSLLTAISASVIPAVSAALARRDKRGGAHLVGSALRMAALLSFPMGIGLLVLGTPIIAFLFPSYDASIAGPLLSTLGLASISVCMMIVCNSVLQAYGFVNLPVLIMVLGGVIKIVANYNLVAIPAVNVRGAPVGNVLCFTLCFVLDLLLIARVIPGRPRYLPILGKPAVAAGVMGLAAWAVYGLGEKVLRAAGILVTQEGEALSRMGFGLCIFLAIGVALVVYLALVVALGAISKDDLTLMPKGETLAKLLRL